MAEDTLTKQDVKFVQEVVTTGNKTQAAQKAYGIKDENYAGVKANRLIRKDKIQKAIKSIAESIDDKEVIEKHQSLLRSTHLDHMVFPLGPKTNEEKEVWIEQKRLEAEKKKILWNERDVLSDEEITELLKSVNCTTRRFVHGETARHVYFWAQDNKAVKDGVELAYKIKGTFAAEKHININFDVEKEELQKIIKGLRS